MKRRFPFGENLLLRTAVLLVAAIALVGAAALYVLRFPVQTRIREEAVADAISAVRPLTQEMLSPSRLSKPLYGGEYDAVDWIVRKHFLGARIARVKYWNAGSIVTYSSLASEVGGYFPDNVRLQRAFQGEATWDVSDATESSAERELGTVLEIYVPIAWDDATVPSIVAEVYIPYAPYAAIETDIRNAVLLATLLAGLSVAIGLYFAYQTGWKAIRKERDMATQRSQEVEALARVAVALSQPGDYDKKLNSVMEEVVRVSGADSAILRVPSPGSPGLHLVAAVGQGVFDGPGPTKVVTDEVSLASRAFRLGVPVAAEDYLAHPNATPRAVDRGIKSGFALPLLQNGHVLGAMSLASKRSGHFNYERVRILTAVAEGIAAVLEQAKAQDEIRHTLEVEEKQIETLRAVTKRLGIESDPVQALRAITDSARILVEAQYGALCIWDRQGNHVSQTFAGMSAEERAQIGFTSDNGLGVIAVIRDGDKTVRLSDVSNHPRSIGFPPGHPPMKTLLGAPIAMKDGQKGALYLTNKKDGKEFTDNDERIIALFAALAEVLLDNLSLYQEVARERSTLQAVQESMVEGLVVIDAHGRELYRNSALESITGLTDSETLGVRLTDILGKHSDYYFEDPRTLTLLLDALTRCHEEGPIVIEAHMKNPHRRTLRATVFPIRLQGAESMSGVLLRDYTQERDVERRRDAFVSVASHELRTPLTTIVGFAEILLNRKATDDQRRAWLDLILHEARRMTDIVEDMLNISRIQSGKIAVNLEPVSIEEIAEKVVSVIQPTSTNHTLVVHAQSQVPPALADKEKLAQVLVNLLSNAVKYSPKGGEVTLTAAYLPANAEVRIAVTDNGIGISKEDQERLFTSFTRIRRPETQAIRGTGLGLYIVKGLVELMHGRIWVESEVNKGSTFYVALPVAPSEIPAADNGTTPCTNGHVLTLPNS